MVECYLIALWHFADGYSKNVGTCSVTSVKLQIANYFWLTANPIIHEISSTIIGQK